MGNEVSVDTTPSSASTSTNATPNSAKKLPTPPPPPPPTRIPTPPPPPPPVSARTRQAELERHGVLVPPKFGITAPFSSPSLRDRLPTEPSLWALLHTTDTSYCLLNDYMYPGLHVAGQDDELGRFRTSFTSNNNDNHRSDSQSFLTSTTTKNSNTTNTKYVGRCFLERLGPRSLLQLRFGTSSVPDMSAGVHVLPGCALFGHLTTTGHAWAGALMDYTFRLNNAWSKKNNNELDDAVLPYTKVNLKLGSWMDGRIQINEAAPFRDSFRGQAHEWNGYAAVTMLGALCAVEAKVPLAKNSPLEVSTKSYVSMDLDSSTLPVKLAVERDGTLSTLSISQLLSFDRYQYNVLEDRAPRVLNRVGWTVRVDHDSHPTGNVVGGGTTSMALGGAWQLNRGLAVKAVLRPEDDRLLSTAVIWKRWEQPRATASFLFRHSLNSPLQFLGIGLELETGSLPREEQFIQTDKHLRKKNNVAPSTRAVFDDEL